MAETPSSHVPLIATLNDGVVTIELHESSPSSITSTGPNRFEVQSNAGLSIYQVQSALQTEGPVVEVSSTIGNGSPVAWTNNPTTGQWTSPELTESFDFKVETRTSSGAIHYGSGYVRVRDTGGTPQDLTAD